MLADKGFDSDGVREAMLFKGILPVIPPKLTRKAPPSCDRRAYRDRNRIERMFNRPKQFRRIATRYDKTAMSFLAFLSLAAVKLWPPILCQQNLERFARSTFCELASGYSRVNEICNWIHDYVSYEGGVSDALTSTLTP
jgi:hypothetical protein